MKKPALESANPGDIEQLSLIARKLGETSDGRPNSSIMASHKAISTDPYLKTIGEHRPIAVGMVVGLFVLAPLVFRYAMYASSAPGYPGPNFYALGNASMFMYSDWECESCNSTPGITIKSLDVFIENITNPNIDAGVPSLAVFISSDLKEWKNYFVPDNDPKYIYVETDGRVVSVNNTIHTAACLGPVQSTYVVACLNLLDLASSVPKMDPVMGPPFDDRCFQMDTACGVPCADLSYGQSPPFCVNGKIDLTNTNLIHDNTTDAYLGQEELKWGEGMGFFDWLVLFVIFLDTFGNILRFLPVLSGRPNEVESTHTVLCTGTSVFGCGTPIVSENEAIFLRGLVGRTTTMLHTVGSRHNIKGLYVDVIINELRKEKDDDRLQMWCAWIQFITFLAKIKTKSMNWEFKLDNLADYEAGVGGGGLHDPMAKPYEDDAKPQKNHLVNVKDTSTQGYKVIRTLRTRKNNTVQFDCGLADVKFKGVAASVDNSYDFDIEDELYQAEEDQDFNPLHTRGRNPMVTQSLDDMDRTGNIGDVTKLLSDQPCVESAMEDMLPLIVFLNGWLETIKHKDSVYNYKDKTMALKSIFQDAHPDKFFDGATLIEVQDRLALLFALFNGDKIQAAPDASDGFNGHVTKVHNRHMHKDENMEVSWTITRKGLPDWNISWDYWSRARVKAKHQDDKARTGVQYESTRIKRGTIVHLKLPQDVSPVFAFDKWLNVRAQTYIVLNCSNKKQIQLQPWPLVKSQMNRKRTNDVERGTNDESDSHYDPDLVICRSIDDITLIERNRGKAGALNVYLDYMRLKAGKWATQNRIPLPVQTLGGIIDARHMLAEPAIYWNEALPHFALKDDSQEVKKVPTILVQYPQFFSNVGREDYLDNKNSGYYTIWQTLRDCAKVCTSSGTNAIWDITDPDFIYATTSRIEDTATTQQVFEKNLTVHLPSFVAFGIAKDTEDYIEAVYRWSTGAVELCWATLFSRQIYHFVIVLIAFLAYGYACFSSDNNAYYLWLVLLFFTGMYGYLEKSMGYRPLRSLNVTATIVMNSMYWISNLTAVVWTLVLPARIALYSAAPMSASQNQSLTWAYISLILRLPIGVITDRIIALSKFLSPKTVDDKWNYNMVLWRSSQLYVCSFAYTLLSLWVGTRTAFRAMLFDGDNTMWSSYRISDDMITKARGKMKDAGKLWYVSFQFYLSTYFYGRLLVQKVTASMQMPDVLTKYFVVFVLLYQVMCIVVSVMYTNKTDAGYILVTLVICTFNFILTVDIALLLMPQFQVYIGRPVRLEYVFGFISFVLVMTLVMTGELEKFEYYQGLAWK